MIGGEKSMKNLYFDDFEDLVDDIRDKFYDVREHDKFNDVSIVAKYEEARQIISELICAGFDIRSLEIGDAEISGYDDEYIITLISSDDEDEIWCEPMLVESGYLTDESTITYVLDNCSSTVIPYCKAPIVYEVTVGVDEEEYDCENNCCECDKDAVSTSNTHSYSVNSKSVSKEEFEKVESEFNDVLKKNLLSLCEVIDEMNEWRKLFSW